MVLTGNNLSEVGETVEARAISATLACIARHGLGKTTIDDVAREAGCSRATLYRYFDGKAGLVAAAFAAERDRIVGAIRAAADEAPTLEDAVVAMLVATGHELVEHPALRFVADVEPERLLPHLTFGGGDRFLGAAAVAIAPSLERFLPDSAERAAEWIARIALALWLSPTAPVSLTDPTGMYDYVREFVLPAISPSTAVLVSPRR